MALLDKMPGVGMPVSEVPRALRELWKTDEGESPTKFRAVQSNLILHFGLEATESEAKVVLDRALTSLVVILAGSFVCALSEKR